MQQLFDVNYAFDFCVVFGCNLILVSCHYEYQSVCCPFLALKCTFSIPSSGFWSPKDHDSCILRVLPESSWETLTRLRTSSNCSQYSRQELQVVKNLFSMLSYVDCSYLWYVDDAFHFSKFCIMGIDDQFFLSISFLYPDIASLASLLNWAFRWLNVSMFLTELLMWNVASYEYQNSCHLNIFP